MIAAIAVPGVLRARMRSNESATMGSMRAILGAQTAYANSCGSSFYADSLARLGAAPVSGGLSFIDADLAMDPATKSGYLYTLTPGPAVPSAPPSCNGGAAGTGVPTYFLGTSPIGSSGTKFYGANQAATIFEGDSALPPTEIGPPPGGTPIQ